MYRLTEDPDAVVRLEDGATIPRGHRWWDEYEEWCAAGTTPEPAIDTGPTLEQQAKTAITRLLDETVQARGYDSIVSCVSYIGSSNETFAAEARAASDWRDAVYTRGYELLASPPAGVTTVAQVLDLLPRAEDYGWPQQQ